MCSSSKSLGNIADRFSQRRARASDLRSDRTKTPGHLRSGGSIVRSCPFKSVFPSVDAPHRGLEPPLPFSSQSGASWTGNFHESLISINTNRR